MSKGHQNIRRHLFAVDAIDMLKINVGLSAVAAHLRTILKERGSFAHTIFPGKHIPLCRYSGVMAKNPN